MQDSRSVTQHLVAPFSSALANLHLESSDSTIATRGYRSTDIEVLPERASLG